MDNLDKEARSKLMAKVRSKDTATEMKVRKLVYGLGFRYRVNVRGIAGTPDMVFKKRKKVIFIHGCFWHRHDCCNGRRVPKSRINFWENKFAANIERDSRAYEQLKAEGWDYLVIWECEMKNENDLKKRILNFLSP